MSIEASIVSHSQEDREYWTKEATRLGILLQQHGVQDTDTEEHLEALVVEEATAWAHVKQLALDVRREKHRIAHAGAKGEAGLGRQDHRGGRYQTRSILETGLDTDPLPGALPQDRLLLANELFEVFASLGEAGGYGGSKRYIPQERFEILLRIVHPSTSAEVRQEMLHTCGVHPDHGVRRASFQDWVHRRFGKLPPGEYPVLMHALVERGRRHHDFVLLLERKVQGPALPLYDKPRRAYADLLFDFYDDNQDKAISREEFATMLLLLAPQTDGEELENLLEQVGAVHGILGREAWHRFCIHHFGHLAREDFETVIDLLLTEAFSAEEAPATPGEESLGLLRGNSTDAVSGEGVVWNEMLRGAISPPGEESLSDRLRSSTALRIEPANDEAMVWQTMHRSASLEASPPAAGQTKQQRDEEAMVWAKMGHTASLLEPDAARSPS